MILTRDFFMGDPLSVAQNLLGTYLCRRMCDGTIIRAKIAEVELYHESERGCHAYGGKCTTRNEAMFLCGGYTYVYLCYGMYNMLNIVLGECGTGVAVLVRALCAAGCDGPGKLTRKLNITRNDNKVDLCAPNSDIWLEERDTVPQILSGARIGIDYAGDDAALPWRFVISDCPYISHPV